MCCRDVSALDIHMAILYGRTYFCREAIFSVVGKKEVEEHRSEVDLTQIEGLHVVSSRHTETLITVYKNRTFRRRDFRKR